MNLGMAGSKQRAAETDKQIAEGLKRQGRRMTDQRRLILEVVRRADSHPTAEWVYRKVRRRLPRLSLGTVYRNLKLLVEQGLIQELDSRGLGRYDGSTGRHDHFTCQACGRIIDVTAPVDPALDRRMASRMGFEISHHLIEFYGRCLACRGKERRRARAGKRREPSRAL